MSQSANLGLAQAFLVRLGDWLPEEIAELFTKDMAWRMVQEYIEANLSDEMTLTDLAALRRTRNRNRDSSINDGLATKHHEVRARSSVQSWL
jgi:hypothetical protein